MHASTCDGGVGRCLCRDLDDVLDACRGRGVDDVPLLVEVRCRDEDDGGRAGKGANDRAGILEISDEHLDPVLTQCRMGIRTPRHDAYLVPGRGQEPCRMRTDLPRSGDEDHAAAPGRRSRIAALASSASWIPIEALAAAL